MEKELIELLVTGGAIVLNLAALFLIVFVISGGLRK